MDELTIKTSVDASGVGPGVDQTVAGLQKVAGKAQDVATQAKGMGAAMTEAGAASAALAGDLGTATEQASDVSQALEKVGSSEGLTEAGEQSEELGSALEKAGEAASEASTATEAIGDGLDSAVAKSEDVAESMEKAGAAADEASAGVEAMGNANTEAASNVETLSDAQENLSADTEELGDNLETSADALTDNTDKTKGLVEELGSMRESRRIAIELFETMKGGGDTIEGLTGIMRTLLLTTEALSPEYAAIAAVGLALTGLIAAHGHFGASADDAKTSTDALTASLGEEQKAVKGMYDDQATAAQTAFEKIGSAYDALTAKLNAQIAALKERQRLEDEYNDAKLAAQIAQLDAQEAQAEEGKTKPEQEVIKTQYTAERLSIRQQAAQAKAAEDVSESGNDLVQAQRDLAAKQKEVADQEAAVVQKKAALDMAAVSVPSDYQAAQKERDIIASRIQGGIASSDDFGRAQTLDTTLPVLQAAEAKKGPQYDAQLADLQKQLDDVVKKQTTDIDAYNKAKDAGPAAQAVASADELAAQKDIDKAAQLRQQIAQINAHQNAQVELAKALTDQATVEAQSTPEIVKLSAAIDAASLRLQTALEKASTLTVVDATEAQNASNKNNAWLPEDEAADAAARPQPAYNGPPATSPGNADEDSAASRDSSVETEAYARLHALQGTGTAAIFEKILDAVLSHAEASASAIKQLDAKSQDVINRLQALEQGYEKHNHAINSLTTGY